MEQLTGVVPLVDGVRHVEPLVALQADQPSAARRRQSLGRFGLADPGLAFQQQRLADRQRDEKRGCQSALG